MPEVQIVLNRIGKRCFVNCFERALPDSLTENDIRNAPNRRKRSVRPS